MQSDSKELHELLREHFGFTSFRPGQEAIIRHVVAGNHALAVMPTGMGKSLCYQLPSLVHSGLTLVISPLIALMKDQVDAAVAKGLQATFINSSLSSEARKTRYQQLAAGKFKLVYVTPERFRKAEFLQALAKQRIDLLAVDEAHCISQWGHDFRPDYSRLREIREKIGNPPTLALTATATQEVQEDIVKQLGLTNDDCPRFLSGVERPNLSIESQEVYGDDEKLQWMTALRHQHPGPSIIYFSLVATLQRFSGALHSLNLDHSIYHGQLPAKPRRQAQEAFIRSDVQLMLATPAFGLGVDKSNIRLIIHAEMPGSIEAYYQEVGRAGRDGQPSQCVLLYDPDDVSIQMDFIKWANPDPGFIHSVHQLIRHNPDQVKAGGLDYLREKMNFYNRRDFRVETAVNLLERWGALEFHNGYQVVGEIPEEYLDDSLAQTRLQRQNEKLLAMVQMAKLENDLKSEIYSYFGVTGGVTGGVNDGITGGATDGAADGVTKT